MNCNRCGERTREDERLHHREGGVLCLVCYHQFHKGLDANAPHSRGDYYLRTYGISARDYTAMFTEQDGRCLICQQGQEQTPRPLVVDHNHETGDVRGLLCAQCNSALGMLGDNPAAVARAVTYLLERGAAPRLRKPTERPEAVRRIRKKMKQQREAEVAAALASFPHLSPN